MSRISFLLLFILVSCASPYQPEKTYSLTLLHTNDHHGRFYANRDGEWGLAARSTLIQKLRTDIEKNDGNVLLLDAGDVNTGVPQSDMLDAEPDFKGMARLKYDAMANKKAGLASLSSPPIFIRTESASSNLISSRTSTDLRWRS
jgi:5'-nucleotidase/UDP-sugar diphosphatase